MEQFLTDTHHLHYLMSSPHLLSLTRPSVMLNPEEEALQR